MTRSSVIALLAACGGGSATSVDAPPADALDKSATCATTFGETLTASYGRLDGTIVAIVPPDDQACAMPNRTHLVIQILMGGLVYREVVDVLSNQGDPNVRLFELDHPLVGAPWADGWHTDAMLDYPSQLGLHATQFTPVAQGDLVTRITDELVLGAKISVYGTSETEHDSAHLIHRTTVANTDGAIVIDPDGASPHWLTMTFDEYVF